LNPPQHNSGLGSVVTDWLEFAGWKQWMLAVAAISSIVMGRFLFPQQRSLTALPLILVFAGSLFGLAHRRLVTRLQEQLAEQREQITALERQSEALRQLAILDPLTGLYNRRFAVQHLSEEIARAMRQGSGLITLVIDLNGLKLINDHYGHAAGDQVLREFAMALRRAIRSSDIAARIGGDEFLVILSECSASDLPKVLGRLGNPTLTLNEKKVEMDEKKVEIHYAAGWTEYVPGEKAEELLLRADQMLYEDKRTGRSKQQAQLARDQFRAKEQFNIIGQATTSVAHDFNNLLTVIKGYTELILDGVEASTPLYARANEINKAVSRATALLQQLLAFSRKQNIQPTVVDLNRTIETMEFTLHRAMVDRVPIKLDLARDLYKLCVDPGQLEQLLMILLSKAHQNIKNGNILSVQTCNFKIDSQFCNSHPGARMGHYVRLVIGAVPGNHRGPSATQESAKRLDFGLSMVYGIVKQYGGYLWVDPEQKTFSVAVYLPKIDQKILPIADNVSHQKDRMDGQPATFEERLTQRR
jgi:diguanylate cyclase (GGDEF)-like protein